MSKVRIRQYIDTGDAFKVQSKIINQGNLTSDCWMVQFWGLSACKRCELEGSEDCGGKKILEKIKAGKYSSQGLPDVSYPKG